MDISTQFGGHSKMNREILKCRIRWIVRADNIWITAIKLAANVKTKQPESNVKSSV